VRGGRGPGAGRAACGGINPKTTKSAREPRSRNLSQWHCKKANRCRVHRRRDGAECVEGEGQEQAVLLVDDSTGVVTVVQPNEDGSYWRKIVRNKMIRMKEKRRELAAAAYAETTFADVVRHIYI